jgi:hypothetical protein
LADIDNATEKMKKLQHVFTEANQLIEDGFINTANFEEKMEAISTKYETALR